MRESLLSSVKRVYASRNSIVMLTATVISLVLLLLAIGSEGDLRSIYLAISTSLVATVVFVGLQTVLTTSINDELIQTSVQEAVGDVVRDIVQTESDDRKRYVPATVYEASGIPDPRFNQDLHKELLSTERYIFRGVTGRYSAARLQHLNKRLNEVHLFVADPAASAGLAARARHVASYTPGKEYALILKELRNEIYQSIYGAQRASIKCSSLCVHFVQDPQLDRVEIFDRALFLTLFSESAPGLTFPKTLRFVPGSFTYEMYLSQVNLQVARANGALHMEPDMTDSEIIKIIQAHGDPTFDEKAFTTVKQEFDSFSTEFARIQRGNGS